MLRTTRFASMGLVCFLASVFSLALITLPKVTSIRGVTMAAPPGRAMQVAAQGQWCASFDFGVVAVHTHLLPNGKVLAWDTSSNGRVYDPATGTLTTVSAPATTNVFCSGHAFLPDGRLLVTGGTHNCNGWGEPHTNFFDFTTNTWAARSSLTDMNNGRWYPSNCALGNGELLVVSGEYCTTGCNAGNCIAPAFNSIPQVWQLSGSWRSLTSADKTLPTYPWLHLTPDGRVFYSGLTSPTWFLHPDQLGAWDQGPNTVSGNDRGYGSSVWYDDYKVLIAGGGNIPAEGNLPANTAEVINLRAGTLQWRSVGSMANRRIQMNATVLPDGKVLVTGGTSGAGFNNPCGTDGPRAAELWDPVTETWTTMASMAVGRIYHSTAVLLPDGRVLSAGSTAQGPDPDRYPGCTVTQQAQANAEIFFPPYLFNPDGSPAARPSITTAPTSVGYGQTFAVDTPNAASIKQVTLVRLSSVTHSFNQNQRFTRLNFYHDPAGGRLQVTTPTSGNLLPPGHYMLFILNGNGVPSVAKLIQLSGSWLTPASQAMTSSGGAGSVAVTVTSLSGLSWTAVSNASWITVTSGMVGTGNGTVTYTVAVNATGAPRSGTITIAGVTFTVYQATDFTDVPTTHPFYTEISKLQARGITAGCGGITVFCPDSPITREGAAIFIERALGAFTPPTPTSQRFTDVPPTRYSYPFIDDFAFRRVTAGCGDATIFCPDSTLTREQMAIFIERANGIFSPPNPASQRFSDVSPSRAGYAFIDDLAARGITSGCGSSTIYCPDDPVTRGQLAVFLVRAFGL